MTRFRKQAWLSMHLSLKAEQNSEAYYNGAVCQYLPPFLADKKLAVYAGWDLRGASRNTADFLNALARNTSFFATARYEGQPLAFAWGRNIGPRAAELHFATASRDYKNILQAGQLLISELREVYASLCCLVPAPFVGAHKIARALGFQPQGMLKGSCFLAARKRAVAGRIYIL